MFHLLVFLLSLCQLSPVTFSETIDTSKFSLNALNNDDYNNSPQTQTDLSLLEALDYPIIKNNNDETEMDFNDLNSAINMLKHQQQKQQQAMNMNNNFMRFGKRQMESMPTEQALESFEPGTRFERSNGAEGVRDSRRDSFIRFGRSGSGSQFMRLGRTPSDFMRFGRTPSDFMRFGRASSDFMRFGRSPSDLMRLGRNPSDFLRFGRSAPSDFMRFGRSSPSDFMRLGRTPSDFMRFGRTPSDFMRFGRTPSDFMRFGRTPSDFMRFGRNPSSSSSFMRLGRSQNGIMRSAAKLAASAVDKNFMRSGRPDSFMRFGRASSTDLQTNPNFMRFGKRQKNETSQKSSDQNQTSKSVNSEESTTTFPYHELENEVDPIDMMFLNDLTDSDDNK